MSPEIVETWGSVEIPDMSAPEIFRLIQARHPRLQIDPAMLRWDFLKSRLGRDLDFRGHHYDIACLENKEIDIAPFDVHFFLGARRYDGNAAAFFAWIAANDIPRGDFATHPVDKDARFYDPDVPERDNWLGQVFIPCLFNGNNGFVLSRIRDDQHRGRIWKFLGFRRS